MATAIICDICRNVIEPNDETSKYFSLEANSCYPHMRKAYTPERVCVFHLCGECIGNFKDLIKEHEIPEFWNN